MSYFKLVPDDFEVPTRVETERFVVVPLIMDNVAIDFESYMMSVEHLQNTYAIDFQSTEPDKRWPAGATMRSAMLDAGFCEFEFYLRREFTYVVLNRDENRQLGACYVWATNRKGYEAEARMWVRADEFANGFEAVLYSWFRNWVTEVWPFSKVAWPGREIPWDQWLAMPLKER